jgi:DNA polymerase (family 10)
VDKKQAVKTLGLTADVLELLGENEFKVITYRKAERMLDRFDGDWNAATERGFSGIPGIGTQLSAQLREWHSTGSFGPLEDASSLVPPGVLELFQVRGLGPRKIRLLWDAGVDSISALLEAGRAGRVATLKGFGANTQTKLIEEAEFVLRSSQRRHADAAGNAFATLAAQLEGVVARLEAAGSLRRGFETVGDLDAVAVGDRDAILRALEPFSPQDDPTYPWLIAAKVDGMTLQLQAATPESWGACHVMMTGSKPFLEPLLQRAEQRGLEFTSRGLYRNGALVPTLTEQDAFSALGWPYVIPEWREAEHMSLLESNTLPNPDELVRLEQMRGMLHVHSRHSDGANTVREMALGARARGATHLGICDHSQFAFYANGLTPERVRVQWQEIDALNNEFKKELEGFTILKGIECDILADGSLDYDADLLAGFDFVVASVHSSFNLPEAQQTARLIRAVQNPFTTILGHPTGRLLLRRNPYRFDHKAVLEAAEAAGTIIEINANPYRLDLDWREALEYRERLLFAVNTDAHVVSGFDDLAYGVCAARKAALTTDRVVNTWNLERFVAFARNKRG